MKDFLELDEFRYSAVGPKAETLIGQIESPYI